MLTKRPASFLLTPQHRVDALWMDGTGPEVKTAAPPPLEPLGVTPATSADLHELEGLLRKPDPKITLCLTEDANLIDQLHNLTRIMPKFAQFNPPPAAPTPEPSPSAQRVEAEAAQSRSMTNEDSPAAAPTLEFCDLTSGRRRKHASAGESAGPLAWFSSESAVFISHSKLL